MHEFDKNQLLAFHFGEAEKGLRNRIEKHAGECGECFSYLQNLRQTDQQLKSWGDEDPDPATFSAIMGRIQENQPRTVEKPVPVSHFSFVALSAVFGALVVFIVMVFNQ